MRHYIRTALAFVLALQSVLTGSGLTPSAIPIAHAATNTIHLQVFARPPDARPTDVLQAIPHYKWLINQDPTGDPTQP
ncbi:MAG TPA: hypothetical protein VGQ62_08375, partial [Chloroflexota bacterium]|nr:hypothetical protein [Chloroflexota bacterium]